MFKTKNILVEMPQIRTTLAVRVMRNFWLSRFAL